MNKKLINLIFVSIFAIFQLDVLCITPDELLRIDLNKNYKSYKINELRLIRSMVYAKHGYLFMESELRNYFTTNYKWYEKMIWERAELEWNGKPVPPVELTEQEQKFVNQIDKLIAEKSKANYYSKDTISLPELGNIANRFEESEFPESFGKVLKQNGFVIERDKHEQLFHLYDLNRYSNIPSFVTTDLFLQLFHTYFSYTVKSLEKEKLAGLITELTLALYQESLKYADNKNSEIVKMANFNACFFAIAYTLITNIKVKVPSSMVGFYGNELAKIEKGEDYFSLLFNSPVPYSLLIPRGHYTRTPEQQRYFKAMMWLQIAPYCLSDNNLLKNACFVALLLKNGKTLTGRSIRSAYNAVYEPIAFLVGDADNLSIADICDAFERYKVDNIEWLSDPKIINIAAMKLREIERERDQIQPKIKLSCHPKINFMPQRYLLDNDIFQQFIDTARNAEKDLPKGLEVLSVLGCTGAKDILYKYFHENKKWDQYELVMQEQTRKFKSFNDWNRTVYNKWLQSLLKLNRVDKTYPSFMHTRGWQLKNLNTALASWAQLKHDVILYGEQPMAAEMGGGEELPPPVTVGYVEPNLEFWNTCKELMSKNESFLVKYQLLTEELEYKTSEIKSILDFFIKASTKEINHQALTAEEYSYIENLGGTFDYLSLSMLTPYGVFNSWEEVKGPDKTIAVIADVYTRNVPDCPKNAILHEATGFGNTIHVIVEINGLLYLTRGSTFSYYEFPYQSRLTDEEWFEILNKNEISSVDWMNEITVDKSMTIPATKE